MNLYEMYGLRRVVNGYDKATHLGGARVLPDIAAVDEMREGIWMRGQAQLDPLIEYQREASYMFNDMMDNIHREVFQKFFRTQVVLEDGFVLPDVPLEFSKADGTSAAEIAAQQGGEAADGQRRPGPPEKPKTLRRAQPKVGRNDPCPCGSGKKYKKCCGATAAATYQ